VRCYTVTALSFWQSRAHCDDGRIKFTDRLLPGRIEVTSMATDDEQTDALAVFLSGPSLDPEQLGDPPLRDGEDPLLTRERITLDASDE
jgi:hypothetical protein